MSAEIKVDRSRFDASFKQYIKVMSRSYEQAVNDKLFMVARMALWFTHKADKKHIRRDLGRVTYLRQKNYQRLYRITLKPSQREDKAPLAGLIVNKRLGVKGQKGLYGSAMRQAIHQLIVFREISVAYIKSGWLPPIQALGKLTSIYVKKQRDDPAARQIGKPKGRASAAKRNGDMIRGFVENFAFAKKDKKNAFVKYGSDGLQKAFDGEAREMDKYIARHMQPGTDKFNAAQR